MKRTKPDRIEPKSGKTWAELAKPYVQMRIVAAVQGYRAAARRVFREEVTQVCRKLDPDQPNRLRAARRRTLHPLCTVRSPVERRVFLFFAPFVGIVLFKPTKMRPCQETPENLPCKHHSPFWVKHGAS